MSLINDMLRDLDRRRAGMGKTPSLAPVLPSRRPTSRRGVLRVLAAALIGGGLLLLAAYWLGQKTIIHPASPAVLYQGKTGSVVTPGSPLAPTLLAHRSSQTGISSPPTLLAVVPSPQGAAIPGLWLTFSAPLSLSPLPGAVHTLRVRLPAHWVGRLPIPPVTVGIASLKLSSTDTGILLLARAATGFRLRLVTVPEAQPAHSILALQARPVAPAKLQIPRRRAARVVVALKNNPPVRIRPQRPLPTVTTTPSRSRSDLPAASVRGHATPLAHPPRSLAGLKDRREVNGKSMTGMGVSEAHSSSAVTREKPTKKPRLKTAVDFSQGRQTVGSASSQVRVRLQPTTPAVRAHQAYNRAMKDFAVGHATQGRIALGQALAIDPQLVPARLLLAGLEAKAGKLQAALSLLNTGLALPSEPTARLPLVRLKARVLMDAGHSDRALAVLEKNIPGVRTNPDYHALLAGLQVRAGHYRRAARQYAALLTLNPNRAVWWLGLGIALDQSGKGPAALKAYQNALQHSGLSVAASSYAQHRLKLLRGEKR